MKPTRRLTNPARFASTLLRTAALASAAVLLAGCQSGPQSVPPGEYRLYATSAGATSAQPLEATITGQGLTLTTPAEPMSFDFGAAADEFTLCPPSGKGRPTTLDAAMTVGDVQLARPAIFGDCGVTKPVRVTVVDLDSVDTSAQFPFTRWVEFCNRTDPDCAT